VSLVEAILLGIVQGLTEFLPVSSSGHLVLAQALLDIDLPGVTFEVTAHMGTLCAVVWVYRQRILQLSAGALRGRAEAWRYVGLLVVASVPAAAVGGLAAEWFEAAFGRPLIAAGMLLVTGAAVYTVRFTAPRATDDEPSVGQAVWIGVAQALAILPGISRSGSTLAVGAWRGVEVVALAEFSFLMSIPAILGAGLLELGSIGREGPGAAPLVVGFFTALLTGVVAIQRFVRLLKSRGFHRFAWYCWTVGVAYLLAAAAVPGLR